jgi:hypothetical protein
VYFLPLLSKGLPEMINCFRVLFWEFFLNSGTKPETYSLCCVMSITGDLCIVVVFLTYVNVNITHFLLDTSK